MTDRARLWEGPEPRPGTVSSRSFTGNWHLRTVHSPTSGKLGWPEKVICKFKCAMQFNVMWKKIIKTGIDGYEYQEMITSSSTTGFTVPLKSDTESILSSTIKIVLSSAAFE